MSNMIDKNLCTYRPRPLDEISARLAAAKPRPAAPVIDDRVRLGFLAGLAFVAAVGASAIAFEILF